MSMNPLLMTVGQAFYSRAGLLHLEVARSCRREASASSREMGLPGARVGQYGVGLR